MKFKEDTSLGILGDADSEEMWVDILSHIPDSDLLKPNVKILSIACGHGTEARILSKRMLALGVSKDKVCNSIWVNDKYMTFTNRAKKACGFTNVITGDFLAWETTEKFDIIVGNPPYTRPIVPGIKQPKGNNLWTLFVKKAYDMSNDDAYMSFITPDSWMSANSKILDMFKENHLIWCDTTVGKYFRQGSSFTAWVMKKSKGTDSEIDGKKFDLSKVSYMPKNFHMSYPIHQKVIYNVKSKIDSLNDATCHSDHKKGNLSKTPDGTYKFKTFHTNAQTPYSKVKGKHHDNHKIIWTLSGYYIPFYDPGTSSVTEICHYILVNDSDEADTVMRYMDSNLYKFIVTTGKWSGFSNSKVINGLPKLDHKKKWTNDSIYKHFKLTPEEIDYVEEFIKPKQPKQ